MQGFYILISYSIKIFRDDFFKILICLLLCLLVGAFQSYGQEKEGEFNFNEFQIDESGPSRLFPSPSELLETMAGLDSFNWSEAAQVAKSMEYAKPESKEELALLLGVFTSDAFLAVHAQDVPLFELRSKKIFEYSGALRVADSLMIHSVEIQRHLSAKDWTELSNLMETVQVKIRNELEAKSRTGKSLAAITLLAAWTRGTEIFSSELSENYDEEVSRNFRQSDLIGDLIKLAETDIEADALEELRIKKLTGTLVEIKEAVEFEPKDDDIEFDPVVPKEIVAKIKELATAAIADLRK